MRDAYGKKQKSVFLSTLSLLLPKDSSFFTPPLVHPVLSEK